MITIIIFVVCRRRKRCHYGYCNGTYIERTNEPHLPCCSFTLEQSMQDGIGRRRPATGNGQLAGPTTMWLWLLCANELPLIYCHTAASTEANANAAFVQPEKAPIPATAPDFLLNVCTGNRTPSRSFHKSVHTRSRGSKNPNKSSARFRNSS